jgi:hypothetical protein
MLTLRRLAVFALLPLSSGALSGGLACGSAEPGASEALRLRFPERAAEVLERGEALAPTAEGFVSTRAGADALGATLLAGGEDALRLRLPGFEVRVREEGGARERALDGRVVTYAREGGTSFWAAVPAGLEEWLLLDAEHARGRAAAAWEVRGAALEQHGDAVSLVDGAGVHRVWVTAPAAWTASGRAIPARLAAAGSRIELAVDADGEAALVDPVWSLVAPMLTARRVPVLTTLQNGQVLATGGFNPTVLASAELYDPVANVWSSAGSMSSPRDYHTATLLPSGVVLVAGGDDGMSTLASADLYDPVAAAWSPAGAMTTPRESQGTVLLGDGTVLAAGGTDGATILGSAEVYDPVANAWSAVASMSTPRSLFTLTALQAGGAIAVGGNVGAMGDVGSAEVYDPVANAWTATPAIPPRQNHQAVQLANGQVLVSGGYDGTIYLDTAYV